MSVRSGKQPNNVAPGRARQPRLSILVVAIALLQGAVAPSPAGSVLPGIDVWVGRGFEPLQGKRIGLIANVTSMTADGRSTVEVLAATPDLTLAAIFSPEHSFFANREGAIDAGTHAATGLPLFSLYGETRRPTAAMLADLDALVFDIQDVGTRIYTYATTLAYCMEEAAAAGIPIVVLDRPNPIGGTVAAGPVLDDTLRSFVGYARIALRHGMTIGELARYFNVEREIHADLTVVPMQGWHRDLWFDGTGLEWVNPSPNIRNPEQALLYPVLGPLEWTDISVGRGTDEPFEWFGAPWVDGRELAAALNAAGIAGLRAVPRRLRPEASTHAAVECGGAYLEVTDRDALDTGLALATIAVTLERLYPDVWERSRLAPLWGDPRIDEQLDEGRSATSIAATWGPDLDAFRQRRARYLLYE